LALCVWVLAVTGAACARMDLPKGAAPGRADSITVRFTEVTAASGIRFVHTWGAEKLRNVLDYLPDRQRAWVKAILQRAYRSADVAAARRLLTDLARRLDTDHPSAAESVREGLDETLTVLGLHLPET
jgi:hypothetical protein